MRVSDLCHDALKDLAKIMLFVLQYLGQTGAFREKDVSALRAPNSNGL